MATNAMLARVLGFPEGTSEDVLTGALAERVRSARRSAATASAGHVADLGDTPGDRFHRLAELRARAEGCSLAEAYSRQASSTPELYDDVRNAQPRY
jgi:hypothetical protein